MSSAARHWSRLRRYTSSPGSIGGFSPRTKIPNFMCQILSKGLVVSSCSATNERHPVIAHDHLLAGLVEHVEMVNELAREGQPLGMREIGSSDEDLRAYLVDDVGHVVLPER